MYNRAVINQLVSFIQSNEKIADKRILAQKVQQTFNLTKDGSIFYGCDFAIRFCTARSERFSNTVLSLSALQKYDDRPFIVCVVALERNYLFLANTTFLQKISHSSQKLRIDNIRGSFNGSDIMRDFEGFSNEPENFEFLFTSHENYPFRTNLERLVEATNNICPTGKRFMPTKDQILCIEDSVERAISFLASREYEFLNDDLRKRVDAVASEIVIAAFIDNVNLRGRIIEYLITSADDLRGNLIEALHLGTSLPPIYTADKLGDYECAFEKYCTATDIKTKILFLSSNPKGYNIDKLLAFLSRDRSVYLLYIVAIDAAKRISTRLCSMYHRQILNGTRILKLWAGRNSRGVTQYDGHALVQAVSDFDSRIDRNDASAFIQRLLDS